MAKKSKKHRDGVVYSTNNNFEYDYENENQEIETLAPQKQNLKVLLDNKAKKKGKKATLITGFVGTEDDMKDLAKTLKTKCAVGGSSKDGEIIIQGDFREKAVEILKQMGYKARKI
ncbi:MAG: translation initiation factor [Bacteroidales bacterium]|jgi:translation initiation factor 1|nr:translation initiation factor [Bacteroidales bacterium]